MKFLQIVCLISVAVSIKGNDHAKPKTDHLPIPSSMFRAMTSLIVDHLFDSLSNNRFQREGTMALQEFLRSVEVHELFGVDPDDQQAIRWVWDNLIDSINIAFAETPIKREVRLYSRSLVKSLDIGDITALFLGEGGDNLLTKCKTAVDATFGDNNFKADFVAMLELTQNSFDSLKDTLRSMLNIKVPIPVIREEL